MGSTFIARGRQQLLQLPTVEEAGAGTCQTLVLVLLNARGAALTGVILSGWLLRTNL